MRGRGAAKNSNFLQNKNKNIETSAKLAPVSLVLLPPVFVRLGSFVRSFIRLRCGGLKRPGTGREGMKRSGGLFTATDRTTRGTGCKLQSKHNQQGFRVQI